MPSLAVVGAGIVGASVAYHAAHAGADVTLLDKSLPASGVTADSFAWIGGPSERDRPDASKPLRMRVLAEWRRLEAELPGVRVRWTGSLAWGDGQPPDGFAPTPDERLVDGAEVLALEPALRVAPARALLRTTDGAVDPVSVTETLVRGAREHGARLRVGVVATSLRLHDRSVTGVETSRGFVPADTVVVAAGADAPLLCAPLGVRLAVEPSASLLARFAAPPGLVRTIVSTGTIEARTTAEGEVLVAAEYTGEVSRDDLTRTARELRRRLLGVFEADESDVHLVGIRVGMRPMPTGGLPIIGRVPGIGGLYLAVMHSGVTLAPAVGRLVGSELVGDVEAKDLRGLRPAAHAP
jgi:glycine/D-amino acid oxidase-like deaminating enzyme